MNNLAFTRCPICRVPYAEAERRGHPRIPCLPVHFVFAELVALGRPRPYRGADSRWTSSLEATVLLGGKRLAVECLLRLGVEFPD